MQREQALALVDDHRRPRALLLHAERHAQVRGKALVVPRVVGDLDVAQGADRRRDVVMEGGRHVARADGVLPGRQVRGHPLDDLAGDVRCGDELHPDRLRERPDQRGHELGVQARHHPVEALRADPVEHDERDVDRHAVGIGPRLELVAERQLQVALRPRRGELRLVDLGHVLRQEQVEGERQQCRVGPARGLPPGVEVPGRDDVGREPLVVEVEQDVVVHHEPAPTGLRLEPLRLGEQLAVVVEERVVRGPLALDERVTDEQLARVSRIDLRVQDPTLRDDRHAVEQHLLVGHRGALLGGPRRLGVGAPDQVRGELLGPLGLDPRDVTTPQARGLDELARHHPGRGLLGETRPGEDREPCAPRAQVLVARLTPGGARGVLRRSAARADAHLGDLLHAELGEQPGQQRLVDPVGVPRETAVRLGVGEPGLLVSSPRAGSGVRAACRRGSSGLLGGEGRCPWRRPTDRARRRPGRHGRAGRRRSHRDAERLRHLAQLRDDVLPLAQPQVVEELGLAQAAERAAGQLPLLLLHVLPEVQVAEEVRRRVVETRMRLIGLRALLGRPLAWVLDRERGRDDDDLARDVASAALDDHPAQPRVHRKLGEGAADVGQPAVVGVGPPRAGAGVLVAIVRAGRPEGAELGEELHPVADRAGVRWVDEREPGDVLRRGRDPDRDHLQDHRRERRPQDLGLGELRS
ncbi:hypothetical protein GALL_414860 [mine drainage metagenome]|uniref:Uncharacterized protein n=1 Tax=mine drainage metagenome TaxID=410659 RepID=A0A1J5QA93_9ZZZZ